MAPGSARYVYNAVFNGRLQDRDVVFEPEARRGLHAAWLQHRPHWQRRLLAGVPSVCGLLLVFCIVGHRTRLWQPSLGTSVRQGPVPLTDTVVFNAAENGPAYVKLLEGSCRSEGAVPIRTRVQCQEAAEALGLHVNGSKSIFLTEHEDVPEGCYYCTNVNDNTNTLWFGCNKMSKGKGAETSLPGTVRQPLCIDPAKTRKATTEGPTTTAAPTTTGFNCVEGFSTWETSWSKDKKEWCCKVHPGACSRSGSPHAGAETKAVGKVRAFRVVARAGAIVRATKCFACMAVGKKRFHDVVRGVDDGDWVELVDETGFLPKRKNDDVFLEKVDDSPLLSEAAGRSSTREPESSTTATSPEPTQRNTSTDDSNSAIFSPEDSTWNCRGDSKVWKDEQKDWCCIYRDVGCYTCDAGLDDWQADWSRRKQRWCCSHAGAGCGHDECRELDESWSPEKKVFCCSHYRVGCDSTTTSTFTTATTTTQTTTAATTEGVRADPFNCTAEDPVAWPRAQKVWCCSHRELGCDVTTSAAAATATLGFDVNLYDCAMGDPRAWPHSQKEWCCTHADLSNWHSKWSADKAEWCCKSESLGCADFDCTVGLWSAETSWPKGKQKWCCTNKNLGCVDHYECNTGAGDSLESWSPKQRTWCCKNKEIGCAKPYKCDGPMSEWTAARKEWCCRHEDVCPKSYDCHTGAANWAAAWPLRQQAWCCKHESVGCGYQCAHSPEAWPRAERVWCCVHRGLGCQSVSRFAVTK